MESLDSLFHVVRNRPLPKEPLSFFQYKQGNRLFLTVTDSTDVWEDDLIIAERLFADMVVLPFVKGSAGADHTAMMSQVQDILKQRMKYPNVKDDPRLEKIAKTWVLGNKVRVGPPADSILGVSENSAAECLASVFKEVKSEDSVIHFMKVEVNGGAERQFVYKLLDNGFRPSLLLVRWSHDVDDNVPTAHCVGHLLNSGYCLVSVHEGYSLYHFNDQVLYDICSMKVPSLKNPIMDSLLKAASEFQDTQNTSEGKN